jgi:ribonuclease P protein component
MDERLRPLERIRKKKDFLSLYKNGSRFRSRHFSLVFRPNELGFSRLAVVVSKKVGVAVIRNKVKRRMRELFRRHKMLLPEATDVIVVTRPEILELGPAELSAAFLAALASLQKKRSRT